MPLKQNVTIRDAVTGNRLAELSAASSKEDVARAVSTFEADRGYSVISTFALDPATLTLNTQAFHPSMGEELLTVLEAGIRQPESCKNLLATISTKGRRGLYANIISSIWHEKRHFLDFILTNYGAFRVRQFFQVYFNLNLVLEEAKQDGG
jgi:hypothetical protein